MLAAAPHREGRRRLHLLGGSEHVAAVAELRQHDDLGAVGDGRRDRVPRELRIQRRTLDIGRQLTTRDPDARTHLVSEPSGVRSVASLADRASGHWFKVRSDDRRRRDEVVAPIRRHGFGPARRARDRPRRGRLGLGQGGSPIPRRDREPVVCERRPRPPRDRGRGGGTDGTTRGVLRVRRFGQRTGAGARGDARRPRADAGARVPRVRGRRRDRHRRQAGAPLLVRAGTSPSGRS